MGSHASKVEEARDILLREFEVGGVDSAGLCDPIAGCVEPLVHALDPSAGQAARDALDPSAGQAARDP